MKRITFYSTIAVLAVICFFIIIASGKRCRECFSPPVMAAKFFASGLVIFVGSLYFKRKFLESEGIIFEIESEPLLETNEATSGVPFAGGGIVESEIGSVFKSLYTETPCVYYHCIKEKYIKEGKRSRWVIIENKASFVPFFIADERGKLKVDLTNMDDDFSEYQIPKQNIFNPENSEIDCDKKLRQTYKKQESGFLGISSSVKYRKSEYVLMPGTKVFVYGMVYKNEAGLVLKEDQAHPLIISKKNREDYVEEFYRGGNLVYLTPLLMIIGYTVVLYSLNYFLQLEPALFFTMLLAGNGIVAGSSIFSLYNRLISIRFRALNALSNIDSELKRRADLIPNLVIAVKEYSKYEKEVQEIIAEAREKKVFSKEPAIKTGSVIPSLVMVIENYPELKASENFQAFMRSLVDTEERIAYSREFYNRSVRKYNTLIRVFPFLLVSLPLGLKEMEFLSISHEVNNAPDTSGFK